HRSDKGIIQDYLIGPYDGIVKTENLPLIASLIGVAYGGNTPFQAEVYFINISHTIQTKFAVPYFDVFDPRFEDFGIPVAVRGTITFRIGDVSNFIKLHRLQSFSIDCLANEIRDAVNRYVKGVIANVPREYGIPVVRIESCITQINDRIEKALQERLMNSFGIIATGIDIGTIEIDKTSRAYTALKAVTQNVSALTIQAQTEANIKQIRDKQQLDIENYGETLRIQREEAQYAQRKNTQTNHFAAYRVEAQAGVAEAGAQALGQMRRNGSGNTEFGNMGFNPAAIAAEIAIGSTVGRGVADTINNIMKGEEPGSSDSFPPPIPQIEYFIEKEGKPSGPFSLSEIREQIISGAISKHSLAWKKGMNNWAPLADMHDFDSLFTSLETD
ncbi:MAG: SPFH domain-containing protein, partial [Clostridia bacterium]|nr:SPFH domain-containing protein [Clostridia bacterium]